MPKALRLARYGRTDVRKVKDVECFTLSPVSAKRRLTGTRIVSLRESNFSFYDSHAGGISPI